MKVESNAQPFVKVSIFLLYDYLLVLCNVIVRLYCALTMIISDCDETFNYWEPLNLLFRGFGKETWEYSPDYAIRSYFYLVPYYLATSPLRDFAKLTGKKLPPYYYFYFIRIVCLCGFTSFTEITLFKSVRENISTESARWFLLISSISAGMAHASSALLPSSFAMNWVTLGTAFALSTFKNSNSNSSRSNIYAICSFLISGLVGWPFTLALGVAIGMYTLWSKRRNLAFVIFACLSFLLALVAAMIVVDSFYYKKGLSFIPINIVLYNVFATEGEGPEIFGVEPFSYYVRNLLLNFNLLFVAAYSATLHMVCSKSERLRNLVCIVIPLWIWTIVFGMQPHKEERFLYPVYPLISLAAGWMYDASFNFAGKYSRGALSSKLFKAIFSSLIVLVLGLRILNLIENYSAPLAISRSIQSISTSFDEQKIVNLCIGREWYHFPTSMFLPDNFRLRFVKSSFDGLLPGDFPEEIAIDLSTSNVPQNMNSKNLFEADKLIELDKCDLIIDNSTPSDRSVGDPQIWVEKGILSPDFTIIDCRRMIDLGGHSTGIGRILYIPEWLRHAIDYEIDYMDFCLLRPKANQ